MGRRETGCCVRRGSTYVGPVGRFWPGGAPYLSSPRSRAGASRKRSSRLCVKQRDSAFLPYIGHMKMCHHCSFPQSDPRANVFERSFHPHFLPCLHGTPASTVAYS
ncbi:hypothetical protein VTK73DRAFT_9375 [Phialemonium thermophilum]|uniref:Uncharacterized protein n=1 Tax=Phialemonium thermophilum TaxID=223376 RepID=A0ABR3W2P0_9PEZI